MSSVAFDTLRLSQRLADAGLPTAQATGIAAATAEAIGELVAQLATKHDLELLRQEVRTDIASLRQEVKGDIASMRQEMKGDIAQLELRMTIKLGTMMAGAVALTAALVRLL